MPQMSTFLMECAIGMLTAGMSTRAVAREFNVNFSTISRLQRRFREFDSRPDRPHNHTPRKTTPAQDLHFRIIQLQDPLITATRTADEHGTNILHVNFTCSVYFLPRIMVKYLLEFCHSKLELFCHVVSQPQLFAVKWTIQLHYIPLGTRRLIT